MFAKLSVVEGFGTLGAFERVLIQQFHQ